MASSKCFDFFSKTVVWMKKKIVTLQFETR